MKPSLALVLSFIAIPTFASPPKGHPPKKESAILAEGVVPAYFGAADGVRVRADTYMPHPETAPMIVLFHQAGWSRGEYSEIAPKLNELGFNAVAVDLRSGGKVNGVENETHKEAKKAGKKTRYVDALADMRAAVKWLRRPFGRQPAFASGKLILWGSSYSASLVLVLANEVKADAVLAFAPGEYFTKVGKPKTWVRDAAKSLKMPVFITSARDEHKNWKAMYEAIPSKAKTFYVPKTKGNHGSRALWKKFSDSAGYWKATKAFLAAL